MGFLIIFFIPSFLLIRFFFACPRPAFIHLVRRFRIPAERARKSLPPSVCTCVKIRGPPHECSWMWYWGILREIVGPFQFWLKSDITNGLYEALIGIGVQWKEDKMQLINFARYGSLDGSVGIVTGLRAHGRGILLLISAAPRDFSFPKRPDWLWGLHSFLFSWCGGVKWLGL